MDFKKYFDEIEREVRKIFENNAKLEIDRKKDNTFVTNIDLEIDKVIKQISKKYFQFNYYSEETIPREFSFPLLIVDPIDGTKGLIENNGEYCVSVAFVSEENNWGWLYYPSESYSVFSEEDKTQLEETESGYGLVSRSDYKKGLFKESSLIRPMGSIAKKLGYLSEGKCKFVFSKTPKNIWDIAAGTILCERKNLFLYGKNGRIKNYQEYYEGPLLWCSENDYEELWDAMNEL
ncbi:MAG: hypothetical protein GY909_12115 [Oligoflexia bacterium]|nr:hypothetical protein [Oligoflexia bacterium]